MVLYIFTTFFTLYFILNVQGSRQNQAPTHMFVMRVGPCPNSISYKVKISEMSIRRDLYDFSISGVLNITEDIPDGWKIVATMEKCVDIRNLETCDYFQSFPVVMSGCGKVYSDEVDVYTLFFYYTLPRVTCPVKAGNYKIRNYPFFTEENYLSVAETKISTSLFGYTLKLEGFSGDEKILCSDVVLQLLYIRDYNWDVKSTNTDKKGKHKSPKKERDDDYIIDTASELGSGEIPIQDENDGKDSEIPIQDENRKDNEIPIQDESGSGYEETTIL